MITHLLILLSAVQNIFICAENVLVLKFALVPENGPFSLATVVVIGPRLIR